MSRDSDIKRLAGQVVTVMPPSPHIHPISDTEGLQAALNAKADVHGHPYEAVGVVAVHEAANDPHPMYLKQAEADALYDTAGAAAAAYTAAVATAAGELATHAAAADPHTGYQKESEKGQANGYASLDGDGKVPAANLPAGQSGAAWGGVTGTLADQTDLQAALDAKSDFSGSYDDLTDKPTIPTATSQLANDSGFLTSAPVASVAGKTGVVTLAKADVGLGNVDNTSDASKPVSTATQTALNGKEPANANIQAHVAAAHAPANAQKNSDILKSEIEAVLTGEIDSHSHAGGGSGGGMVSVRMTADVANATTSMANATGLSFAAAANSDYVIDANILWNTSGTAVGIKLSADFSSTGHTIAGQWIVNVANGTLDGAAFNADDVTVTTTAAPFTTSNHAKLWSILRTGANAGTFVVRFAAETTGTITIKAGSVLRYEKTL